MREIGRPLNITWTYLRWEDHPALQFCCDGPGSHNFEFMLPPGDYVLDCNGGQYNEMQTEKALVPITIRADESARSVTVDLLLSPLAGLTGLPAPEFQRIRGIENGGPAKLSDFKGQVVLLDFWGYWCGPCIAGMPKLMELHDKYAGKGLVIIGIHDDSVDSFKEMHGLLKKTRENIWKGRDLPFLIALDGGGKTPIKGTNRTANGATTAAYGIQRFPTTVLIDKAGKVVGTFNCESSEHMARLQRMLGIADSVVPEEPSIQQRVEQRRHDTGWNNRFLDVYTLNEHEVLRHVPTPFIPERDRFYFHHHPLGANSPKSMVVPWNGRPEWTDSSMEGNSLRDVLVALGLTPRHQFTGPEELLDLEIEGDWVIRQDATTPQLLAALEQILREQFKREIRFERRSEEKEVVVVRGEFRFHPLTGIATSEAGVVQVMSDQPNMDDDAGGGPDPRWIFRVLSGERYTDRLFLVEADLPGRTENWELHDSCKLMSRDGIDFDRELDLLLSNLAVQTSLKLERQHRKIDVWTVQESAGG